MGLFNVYLFIDLFIYFLIYLLVFDCFLHGCFSMIFLGISLDSMISQ